MNASELLLLTVLTHFVCIAMIIIIMSTHSSNLAFPTIAYDIRYERLGTKDYVIIVNQVLVRNGSKM